jgi:hypothetical protein
MALGGDRGNIRFSACRSLENCDSPLEAEVCACMEGLQLVLQHSNLPIIVEMDCFQLVAATKDKSQDRSSLVHLFSELKVFS